MHHTPTLTRIAFDARLLDISRASDCEADVWSEVAGQAQEFTAFFAEDVTGPYSDPGPRGAYYDYACKLLGAWCEFDSGKLFAGNRAEVAALIGEDECQRWERQQSEDKE